MPQVCNSNWGRKKKLFSLFSIYKFMSHIDIYVEYVSLENIMEFTMLKVATIKSCVYITRISYAPLTMKFMTLQGIKGF